MPLLTLQEYKSTMTDKMVWVSPAEDVPKVALKPYLETIDSADLQKHPFADWNIERVYKSSSDEYIHLLLPSTDKNIYLAVIVQPQTQTIFGHFLLDLSQEYGLEP